MGAAQKRTMNGPWAEPTNPSDHRVYVSTGSVDVAVVSLRYELTPTTQSDALNVPGSLAISPPGDDG